MMVATLHVSAGTAASCKGRYIRCIAQCRFGRVFYRLTRWHEKGPAIEIGRDLALFLGGCPQRRHCRAIISDRPSSDSMASCRCSYRAGLCASRRKMLHKRTWGRRGGDGIGFPLGCWAHCPRLKRLERPPDWRYACHEVCRTARPPASRTIPSQAMGFSFWPKRNQPPSEVPRMPNPPHMA